MTDCTCIECCEWRAARDEHKACAEMVDFAVAKRDQAFADFRQANRRFIAATKARQSGHSATNRTEQQ